MDIASPSHNPKTEDYTLECQEALDVPLADLVDPTIGAGWELRKVDKAVEELAQTQAKAYEEDLDAAGLNVAAVPLPKLFYQLRFLIMLRGRWSLRLI